VHPITPELRKEITETVIAKFNEMKPEELIEE
ncbi:septation protein spoVG, partial [Fusobacterium mortiferum]|nr:septation protein spoVG [Fusobacterium mortiferum]